MPLVESTPDCLATPRLLFALEEMDVDCELRVFGDGHFETTYGRVGPAWVDGDFRLFEGNPILRHLGRAYGMGTLMPEDLHEQARVDAWLDFLVIRIGMSFVRGLPEQAISYVRLVDRHLDGRDWLCSTFTVADCAFVTLAQMAHQLPMGEMQHLGAYVDRLVQRPGYERAMKRWADARSRR